MIITYRILEQVGSGTRVSIDPETPINGFYGMTRTFVDVPPEGIAQRVTDLLAQELGTSMGTVTVKAD